MSLSPTLERVVSLLPATTPELADELEYKSYSGVYDAISRLRRRGHEIDQNEDGQYYLEEPNPEGEALTDGGVAVGEPESDPSTLRTPSSTKAQISKKAKDHLTEMELQVNELTERLPVEPVPEPTVVPGNESMVLFRTDDHFGGVQTNQNGREIFNSEIAEKYVRRYFNRALNVKRERESMGTTFDNAYLILNGDHVTNETIFNGQPHEIDETLDEQHERVARVYSEQIQRLSAAFPVVYIVAQHGNHGELRMGGESSGANADDIFYSTLELVINASPMDNVHFINNKSTEYTDFGIRNHRAHVRHGQNSLEHIGTSSGKNRWKTWFIDSLMSNPDEKPWDIAYRGHYHELKIEPVAGRPVIMGGSLEPAGDYENSLGIAKSRPGSIIHGVTDEEPLAWSEFVYFN